ncbi:MAG: ABC transporter permease subunit [Actinobacteria bacterium]|nr:ABC transporter permease subunit [Actinomycetota bacterium]NCW83616.1 ABC transporter permease subunit [Acidimicrobiia bacterium]NDC99717.1 ABC transporter permease subunit [bacterium]NBO97748.1 ABC transporter permease subunit [Actinomycetota bacterium]NBP41981.1 ABC transporter permease subunit [Actinomycetota bacterium]
MATMRLGRFIAWLVVGVVALFYVVPMIAMTRFAFQRIPVIKLSLGNVFDKWTVAPLFESFTESEFRSSATLSLMLAVATALLTLVLLVPTMAIAHLRSPRMRRLIELSATLPFVVPAIALVVGFAGTFRETLPILIRSSFGLVPLYVVTALPFTHRTIENGLAALDLRTLVNASRSLGASWTRTMIFVIAPNIRASIATASFLAFTVVLGEFTIASLLLKNTLPLYLAYAQGRNPQGAFAVGIVLIIVSTIFVALSNRLGKVVRA